MMIRQATLATPASFSTTKRTGWFYAGMALVALTIVFAGFGTRFYSRPLDLPPLPPRVVAHATLFSTWVLLFVAQTLLVATGHPSTHRRLGIATIAVAAAMVLSAPPLAIGLARRGEPRGADPLVFFLIIVLDLVMFGAFVAAAIYYRRRREVHKRLMLLAMIILLPASISRWPIAVKNPAPVVSGVLLALLVAMIAHDLLVRRRPHPVSVWGSVIILVSLPVRFLVAQTAAWHHFAAWLIR